ncbi:MAG: toxin-antitoxin system YwqK family antitoxin [Aureispira sp.]
MDFKIKNGKDICTIGLSSLGSYFRFNRPITMVWDDCCGSIGKFFCTLPYNEAYRMAVEQILTDNLFNDFSGKTELLYDILEPLLPVFKNGDYHLGFHSNKEREYFKYTSYYNNIAKTCYSPLEVVFAHKVTDINELDRAKKEHQAFLKENAITKKYYPSEILEYTTGQIYPGDDSLYATQPFSQINPTRVTYFEEKIKKGARPFALLFNANFMEEGEDYRSANFILDGHHKLLAYKNLGISPPLAVLTYCPKNSNEIEFDVETLSELLYPCQIEHFLENWEQKDAYIEEVLKDPNSPLHAIIKNGDYEEYYENGQLKHKAFYINDKVDGASKHWYENGQLKQEAFYVKGIIDGASKYWYENGQLKREAYFNKGFGVDTCKTYYESGTIQSIKHLNENGYSFDLFISFYKNGRKNTECDYKNGRMISRKTWDILGRMVHEVLNEKTNRLEK